MVNPGEETLRMSVEDWGPTSTNVIVLTVQEYLPALDGLAYLAQPLKISVESWSRRRTCRLSLSSSSLIESCNRTLDRDLFIL